MASARKRWFRVSDTILREPWPRDVKLTMVMLCAWLNQRWARDGLSAEEACRATLSRAALAEITGRVQLVHSRRALSALGAHVAISIQTHGEFTEIYWPKFSDFQELPSGGRATAAQCLSPPRPRPRPRKNSPFGRGAPPLTGEQRSLVPEPPPDPSEGSDPERLARVLGAEDREAKVAFVREHHGHLVAAARAALAAKGVEDPTRKQLNAALVERVHAFWNHRAKGPRGMTADPNDEAPSPREMRELEEAQRRWRARQAAKGST